jgi:fatty-acyl-CoA synthase
MDDLRTLARSLEQLAQERERGLTFQRRDGTTNTYPYADVLVEARRRGAALQQRGFGKGDRIVTVLIESEDFVFTLYGMILAGIIPVPVYPPFRPDLEQYATNLRHIVETSKCKALITEPLLKSRLKLDYVENVILAEDLAGGDPEAFRADSIGLEDTCFIQYTSGSTAFPKGVVLTHGNLAANCTCFMKEGMKIGPDDVAVCWLPLYHDMGLIGHVFGPTYFNMPAAYMSPYVFIRKPVEWLKLITKYKGTISFAPNFAYGLCASRIKKLDGLDLSSWRVAGCGSEPISYDVLKKFGERFAPAQFDPNAFLCAYGMAESSLAVSFSAVGGGVRADHVDSVALYENGIAEPRPEGDRIAIVNCGKPFCEHDLRVVDKNGDALPERRVGEIVTRGPSVMQGYYDNEEATADTLRDGWLHSGDLGYIADGDLYVCGRQKELIIIAGRNYYPQDIEWAVGSLPSIRTGNVVAFGVAKEDAESVVVVAETRSPKRKWEQLTLDVRKIVHDAVGIRLGAVMMAPPGTLPKTSSGKLQRRKTKDLYLSGDLLRRTSFFSRMAGSVGRAFSSLWQ